VLSTTSILSSSRHISSAGPMAPHPAAPIGLPLLVTRVRRHRQIVCVLPSRLPWKITGCVWFEGGVVCRFETCVYVEGGSGSFNVQGMCREYLVESPHLTPPPCTARRDRASFYMISGFSTANTLVALPPHINHCLTHTPEGQGLERRQTA
jgi:hypothetical protein